ncbi:MAG: hypothetical protein J3K34DRAFT_500584 [Monoraphidium minutum]|nr:MAG: hypothetical protein J3K34DRAFT_500584 [Monoraphidium minutum]
MVEGDAWVEGPGGRAEHAKLGSSSSLSMVLAFAGLCAALWSVILLSSDTLATAALASAAVDAAAPPAVATVRINRISLGAAVGAGATAALNITVAPGDPGGAAALVPPGHAATLHVALGGGAATAALPWPPTGGAAAFAARAPLAVTVGRSAKPFDIYTLPLVPAAARLEVCPPAAAAAAAAGGAACVFVGLPLEVAFGGSAAPGFRVSRAAGGGELLVARATSQRTLRLMAQMLQAAAGGAAAAWLAGACVGHLLMGRALSRLH